MRPKWDPASKYMRTPSLFSPPPEKEGQRFDILRELGTNIDELMS